MKKYAPVESCSGEQPPTSQKGFCLLLYLSDAVICELSENYSFGILYLVRAKSCKTMKIHFYLENNFHHGHHFHKFILKKSRKFNFQKIKHRLFYQCIKSTN